MISWSGSQAAEPGGAVRAKEATVHGKVAAASVARVVAAALGTELGKERMKEATSQMCCSRQASSLVHRKPHQLVARRRRMKSEAWWGNSWKGAFQRFLGAHQLSHLQPTFNMQGLDMWLALCAVFLQAKSLVQRSLHSCTSSRACFYRSFFVEQGNHT